MRAPDPEAANAVWGAVEGLLPPRKVTIPWVVTIPVSRTGSVFGEY